jgi:transposase
MYRSVESVSSSVKRRLRRVRQKTRDKGLAMRCQIVLLRSSGLTREKVAQAVGCSVSWVDRVWRRFVTSGEAGLLDRREDNGVVKLDESFLATLIQVVDQSPQDHGYPRPTWTLELFVKVMHSLTGTKVHPGTMSRALAMIHARRGNPRPTVGCPWSTRRKNRRLAQIRRAVAACDGTHRVAVYLDEVDIHLNPKIGPDWMNRGTQKTVLTPGQNAKRYLCGALDNTTGQIHYVASDRKTSQLFIATLERLLKRYPHAREIHVVLDNFKIHSSRQVQAWLADHGRRLRLQFLPPYCPNDNRIERKWQDLHGNVTRNHRCKTIEELLLAVFAWIRNRNRASQRAKLAA